MDKLHYILRVQITKKDDARYLLSKGDDPNVKDNE